MIEAVKAEGHKPTEIVFHAGYSKTEQQKVLFFVMRFQDGHRLFDAYWNPETDGREIAVDFVGENAAEYFKTCMTHKFREN